MNSAQWELGLVWERWSEWLQVDASVRFSTSPHVLQTLCLACERDKADIVPRANSFSCYPIAKKFEARNSTLIKKWCDKLR
mmetsp:Transcript_66790/g.178562  ORF Transcript_66790/g.178562 Transcript_66790/m.178562 type:complete len:81 (-) Transcript_66790:1105-1347(-)